MKKDPTELDQQLAEQDQTEKALIGGIFQAINPHTELSEVAETIRVEDLRSIQAKACFQTMLEMVDAGIPINMITFATRVKENGQDRFIGGTSSKVLEYVDQCLEVAIIPSISAPMVLENTRRRRLAIAGRWLIQASEDMRTSPDDSLAEAERLISSHQQGRIRVFTQSEAVRACQEDLERRIANVGKLQGIPTGFTDLDWRLDGLQRGEMTIIGARPSQGKTAIGINILEHACFRERVPSLFVSLEMSKAAILRRMSSSVCDISLTSLRSGRLDEIEMTNLAGFMVEANRMPAWWIEAIGGITDVFRLGATIRTYCERHKIQLVIVDYLQKLSAAGSFEKKTYEIGAVSTALKGLAVRTGAAFLVLAQLNRDSTKSGDNVPQAHQLGDSKQIEQDADTIVLIHRLLADPNYQPRLIIAKQRDGDVGVVHVDWDGSRGRFKTHRVNNQDGN